MNNSGNETEDIEDDCVALGRLTDSGRAPSNRYRRRDQYLRLRWNKQLNAVIMEYYYQGNTADKNGAHIRGKR